MTVINLNVLVPHVSMQLCILYAYYAVHKLVKIANVFLC